LDNAVKVYGDTQALLANQGTTLPVSSKSNKQENIRRKPSDITDEGLSCMSAGVYPIHLCEGKQYSFLWACRT